MGREKSRNARVYKKENIVDKMAEEANLRKQGVAYENEGEVSEEVVRKPAKEVSKKNEVLSKESPKKAEEKFLPPKSSEQNKGGNIEKSVNPEQNKKVSYRFAGHESLIGMLKKILPKEFFPSKRLELIFGIVFLVIIFLGLIRFPLQSLMTGDTNAEIAIGFPFFKFLVFDMVEPENFPLRIPALLIDMVIFLVIAYFIDIVINFVHYRSKSLTKEERGRRPKIIQVNKKENISEKITKKLFKEK